MRIEIIISICWWRNRSKNLSNLRRVTEWIGWGAYSHCSLADSCVYPLPGSGHAAHTGLLLEALHNSHHFLFPVTLGTWYLPPMPLLGRQVSNLPYDPFEAEGACDCPNPVVNVGGLQDPGHWPLRDFGFFVLLARPVTLGSSWARNPTHAIAVTVDP